MALVPYHYCNPYALDNELSSQSKSFIIQGEYIKISQSKEKGIGFTLWDCSFLLSDYLQNSYKVDWKDKVCLELGTGCGLVAITLSLLRCKEVIATDLEEIIEFTESVVKDNYRECMQNLKLKRLEWGNSNDIENILSEVKAVDLVIISDCLYEEAPWEKLLDTVLYFSKINPKIEIIFAYKKRYKYQELFLNEILKYYDIEEVSKKMFHADFQNDFSDYHILILRTKI